MEGKAVPDYEKLFFTLMQRVGQIERELRIVHDEVSEMYLDERIKEESLKEWGKIPDYNVKPE